MQRVTAWLKKAFTAQVVSFIAGLLASVVIRALLGGLVPINVGFLLVLVIAFVLFATAVIANTRQDIVTRLAQSGLVTRTLYATKSADGDRDLYEPVIEMIRSAESSLQVVSLYRPPSMQSSPTRVKYYEAIQELLNQHQKRGTRFRYERILQVEELAPGKLSNTQVDEVTFQHCQHVLRIQCQKTSLNLRLRQIPDILGSLSFIVIDNRHIVFAIPTPSRDEEGKLKAFQLGTGVVFTDYDGSLVKEMLQLFGDLLLSADPIYTLDEKSTLGGTSGE